MKSMQKPMNTILSAAMASIMCAGTAHAGGFSLYTESNGSAVGNYGAGLAAEAADASTGWYNPAGLSLIREQQAVVGGVGVFPSSEITGTTTFATVGVPPYMQSFTDMDGAVNALVPSFHYARPLGENSTVGLSIVSPFGLSTEWDRLDPVRYAATFTELLTTNISPEIGGKITENFALGAGIDFQYARVKFNSILGSPAALQAIGANPIFLDSYSYNRGHSFGVGFHGGALLMFNDNHTRLGLNYQSKMNHKFHGYSRLTGNLASPTLANHNAVFWSNNLASNNIEFPEIVTLSAYHDVNEKVALLGSVVYTGWHVLRNIELDNVAGFAAGFGQVKLNSTASQYYRNAWRAAIGANVHVNEQWMLRVGGGYDQTPTRDAFRDVRLPDTNRWALSIGAHYQYRPDLGVDVGYTHLFGENTTINKTITAGAGSTFNVNAKAEGRADLLGVQAVWTMDQPAVPAGK
ncbi:OmpP1/FadL family transporter [Legionella spiritensis]|nr:outer membrane protein transport protein [Legionella spiritensis]